MTTLAYKDGTLASDTQMSAGDQKMFGAVKLFRTDQYLCGVSGSLSNLTPFKEFVLKHESPVKEASALWEYWDDAPDYCGGFSALLISKNGSIWNVCDGPPVRLHSEFAAMGSGFEYALGAMHMGATASGAVRAARHFDMNTGGPVAVISLS